nr:unnamed protein product [Callosobruchus chinensis]
MLRANIYDILLADREKMHLTLIFDEPVIEIPIRPKNMPVIEEDPQLLKDRCKMKKKNGIIYKNSNQFCQQILMLFMTI